MEATTGGCLIWRAPGNWVKSGFTAHRQRCRGPCAQISSRRGDRGNEHIRFPVADGAGGFDNLACFDAILADGPIQDHSSVAGYKTGVCENRIDLAGRRLHGSIGGRIRRGVLVACLEPSDQFTLIAAPKDLPLGNIHCWRNGTAVRLCRHPWVQGSAKAIPILIPGCVQESKVAPHMSPKRIRTAHRQQDGAPVFQAGSSCVEIPGSSREESLTPGDLLFMLCHCFFV